MNGICAIHDKRKIRFFQKRTVGGLLWIFAAVLSISFSDTLALGVREGLLLCGEVVLPSLFPFMVFSDLLVSYGQEIFPRWMRSAFERFFGIRGEGLSAFLIGLLGGFPLGVKATVSLYENRNIDKSEAERLIGFSNNSGPAFVACGIGIGIFHSRTLGVFLWTAVAVSAIVTGVLFREKAKESASGQTDVPFPFSLVDSIKNAGARSVVVCSFVVFFSAVTRLIKTALFGGKSGIFLCFLLSFLEVGCAEREIATLVEPALPFRFALAGFTVDFSGLSVHLQALFFLKGSGLSVQKYFSMKFVQGAICAFLAFFFARFFS